MPVRSEILSCNKPFGPHAKDKIGDAYRVLHREAGLFDQKKFASHIANCSGTHLIKTRSSLADTDHVLRVKDKDGRYAQRFLPSSTAQLARIAKCLFQPILIEGSDLARNIVDHITNPDEWSSWMMSGFSEAFGQDCLEEVTSALLSDAAPIENLPGRNFPIIFLPHPAGDIQVTPVHAAEVFLNVRQIKEEVYAEADRRRSEEGMRRITPSFSRQVVSEHMQNISAALHGSRARLHASLPRILSPYEASLYRFWKTKEQPRISDPDLRERLVRYIDLHEGRERSSSKELREASERLGLSMIRMALEHADDLFSHLKELGAKGLYKIDASKLILGTLREFKERDALLMERAREALSHRSFEHLYKASKTHRFLKRSFA